MTALGERGPARRVVVYQGVMPLHQSAMVGRDAVPLVFNVVLARTIPRCPRAPGSALKAEPPSVPPPGGFTLAFAGRASQPARAVHKSRSSLLPFHVRSSPDSVEKVGVSTRPNFFSAVGAVFKCRRGEPHHPPQTQRSEF